MICFDKGEKLIKKIKFILLIFSLFIILPIITLSQKTNTNDTSTTQNHKIYPDEYSVLDDNNKQTPITNEVILRTLENSRQKYLQALILIERGDTTGAAKYFEQAIKILNNLVSYPGIEQYEDFTDLAQSIIEDYESFVQNIDNLDENSSLFIIRDKLFQEIDQYSKTAKAGSVSKDDKTKPVQKAPVVSQIPPGFTIELSDNEYVQRSITFLTSEKGRKFFKRWLERSGKWFPLMKRIALEEGVPEEIVYLSMIESGLNPHAVSRAKAVGLWQFIRQTGELYGLNANSSVWIDERRDPEKATRAAMRHLKDLNNQFGNWHLAFAAYNCGANCVARAITKSKTQNPDYWDIRDNLPRETRNYVPLYIAAVKIALNPESYGFKLSELKMMPEYKYDLFTINEPVNINALAKCGGISIDEIKDLNPELFKNCTPPDIKEYNLKIPFNSKQSFASNFAALTPEEKQPWIMHEVVRGETVRQIAKKYNTSESEIISLNGLNGYKSRLKKGTVLKVPIEPQEPVLATSQSQESRPSSVQQVVQNQVKDNFSTDKKSSPGVNPIYHTVADGETLYSIAQRYGVRLTDLRNMNNLAFDDDNIKTGQKLKIAESEASSKNTALLNVSHEFKIIKHKVKHGETLAQIADDYDVPIESIKKLNKIKSGKISAGQTLKIETDKSQKNEEKSIAASNFVIHKVKKGESLASIASRYGVSESELKSWNPKEVKGSSVFSGTKLKIYSSDYASKGSSYSSKKVKNSPKYYNVKKGENLSSIAKKFGVTVKSLTKNNKGLSHGDLKAGQKIKIQ